MLPAYSGKKIEVDCLENLSPVEEETDDHDDDYEGHHIPIKIECCYHRCCVVHRIATICNNGLYDLRCVNSVRNVIGVANIGDIAPIISMGNFVRVD